MTGAVATGALLGFFVLSLFSDDSGSKELPSATGGGGSKSAVSAGKSGTADPQTAGGTKPDAASVPASAQAAAGTAASIPARTYTFLQTGGFGTAQAAEAQAAEIRKKGVAAVTEPGDTVFVYSGIAASKEDAKAVTASLIDKKIEVYAKTVSVAGASQIRWNGKAEALQTYLSQSDQLLRMISGLTLVHLEEAKPTPLDEATMKAVKKAHDQWTAGQAEVASGATAEAKTALQKMNNAMNTAKLSLDKYKEAPATATLWNAQTNLMQFVLAEKELLRIIGAS
ncbi:SPOR domain-containing protein [Paenibacillus sp. CC-CFT747]|nr:SPOR domain-containing protein [Paenibacillus sp. CC-CFT747]